MHEPSKRPFGYPINDDALEHFCDPNPASEYHRPFELDGITYAVSPHMALRCTHGMIDRYPAATEKQAMFAHAIRWSNFERAPGSIRGPEYRMLDDSRGGIYRGGPRPLWHRDGKGGFVLNRDAPLVGLGGGPVVPVAMLQLLGRLPRTEVMSNCNDDLRIRFNGGQIIIPNLWGPIRPRTDFHILNTRLPGAFEF